MITFMRALSVEHLKLKRTLTVWMVLVAPFVINLMVFLVTREQAINYGVLEQTWLTYDQDVLMMWSVLMLPLLITLESALLGNSEHANQQWKHLFALPLPRWSYFAAKWSVLFELILAGSIFNLIFALLGGLGSHLLFPTMDLSAAAIPWNELLLSNGKVFLSAILMLSIHTWISLRWKNIVVPIGSGMVAVVMALFVMRSDKYSPLFPWTLPIASFGMENAPMAQILLISILGGLLFAFFAAWDFSRRETL
ncbi:MAG: hypothetical protein CVU39_26625 [Chloroflexi bacterium HGW-Chloroflexi-10]|nr:MAG: hypothetical protein CVU39_26625 [Chloroflexi bacterium HGW-Chloroflexi-10]